MCGVGIRTGNGSLYEGSLYGELFSRSVRRKWGGSVREGTPIGIHHGPPSGEGGLSNLAHAAR